MFFEYRNFPVIRAEMIVKWAMFQLFFGSLYDTRTENGGIEKAGGKVEGGVKKSPKEGEG